MKKTIDIKNIVKCGIIAIILTVLCVPLKTHAATITSIKELSEDEIEKTLEESKECESMYDSALKKKIEVDYAKRTIKNSTPVGWIIFKINNNETNIPLNSGATYSANNLSFSEIDEITGLYSATVYFKTKHSTY